MGAKVLVVEDEPALAEFVGFTLQREGHQVKRTSDGEEAVRVFGTWQPELVILDLMLPGLDGLEVCRHIRRRGAVPILITSAKDTEIDKVIGLEMGADDYLTKPFGPRELVARVKALLRRSAYGTAQPPVEAEPLVMGRVRLDFDQHKAFLGEKELTLTLKEFELLRTLMCNRGTVMSREHLLGKVWGYVSAGDTRTVDVHILRLRHKIEEDPKQPHYIETVRGVGYRMRA